MSACRSYRKGERKSIKHPFASMAYLDSRRFANEIVAKLTPKQQGGGRKRTPEMYRKVEICDYARPQQRPGNFAVVYPSTGRESANRTSPLSQP